MQVGTATAGSPATREVLCLPGSSEGHPGGLREGGFHRDPDTLRERGPATSRGCCPISCDNWKSVPYSSSQSLLFKGRKSKLGQGGWEGRERQSPFTFPCTAMEMPGQMAAHCPGSGAGLSWVHIRALPSASCLPPDRLSDLSGLSFLLYKTGTIITQGPRED